MTQQLIYKKCSPIENETGKILSEKPAPKERHGKWSAEKERGATKGEWEKREKRKRERERGGGVKKGRKREEKEREKVSEKEQAGVKGS